MEFVWKPVFVGIYFRIEVLLTNILNWKMRLHWPNKGNEWIIKTNKRLAAAFSLLHRLLLVLFAEVILATITTETKTIARWVGHVWYGSAFPKCWIFVCEKRKVLGFNDLMESLYLARPSSHLAQIDHELLTKWDKLSKGKLRKWLQPTCFNLISWRST